MEWFSQKNPLTGKSSSAEVSFQSNGHIYIQHVSKIVTQKNTDTVNLVSSMPGLYKRIMGIFREQSDLNKLSEGYSEILGV